MLKQKKIRPFLKWPGGKYRLLDRIAARLPPGKQLIEPFVGGGAIFLNTNFEKYLLNDVNADLISLYQILQKEGARFIGYCREFFTKKFNCEKYYYRLRTQFNHSTDRLERAAIFLYLNRHGYNGLCRYNAGKGEFNVPFGQYVRPYFPEEEMYLFYEKAKKVTFFCEDFSKTMKRAKQGSVVYCDPPYVHLTQTSKFTSYYKKAFDLPEQEKLAFLSIQLATKGIPVLLSNHSNSFTLKIYQNAQIEEFMVQRFISCKAKKRSRAPELLALYANH